MIHLFCDTLAPGVPVAARRRGERIVMVFDPVQMEPMPFEERIILCNTVLAEVLEFPAEEFVVQIAA